jgi:SAM-dependent methyltransferase
MIHAHVDTYQFCANWVAGHVNGQARVLDYGCGAGEIVAMLRERGVNAFGCDVFYEGGDYSCGIRSVAGPYVLRMEGDRIPFDDASFDVVLSNQVFEHVPSLDTVLAEIARVLIPSGVVLSLFPDRSVWREGHCGVPFLHRFPKGSRSRVYYAALMGGLGFGLFRDGKSTMQWAQEFCVWLDQWTHYRSLSEIHDTFQRYFGSSAHSEELWLQARLGRRLTFLPTAAQRFIVRKMAGIALVSANPRPRAAHSAAH